MTNRNRWPTLKLYESKMFFAKYCVRYTVIGLLLHVNASENKVLSGLNNSIMPCSASPLSNVKLFCNLHSNIRQKPFPMLSKPSYLLLQGRPWILSEMSKLYTSVKGNHYLCWLAYKPYTPLQNISPNSHTKDTALVGLLHYLIDSSHTAHGSVVCS